MAIKKVISNLVSASTRARLIGIEANVYQILGKLKLGKWIHPFFIRPYLSKPEEVAIEVTSICDADCIMCPRKAMSRRMLPMDMDLFRKIVDEAVALGVRVLSLNGYGEISTLKNCEDYLSYIRSKSRSITININTNGMRMDEALARLYVKYEVDVVNITIDGATAQTYENIRRHLKLDVVENNTKELIKVRNELGKRRPLVMVGMISMPQNSHEVETFCHKWEGVADHLHIAGLVSRISSVSFVNIENKGWEKTPCFYLWNQMPVLSDGTVALCCDDWNGESALGNLYTNSIKELWSNRERQELRNIHLSGKASSISVCDRCRQPRQGPWWFNKSQGE